MPYGAANFEDLLSPGTQITRQLLNTEIAWVEISDEQKNRLIARLKKGGPTEFGLVRLVETRWIDAHKVAGVTVDQLKMIDMDSHPEFKLLRAHGEFSPEGWFCYFWKEAKGNMADVAGADKTALDEMARTLFVTDGASVKVAPGVRENQVADAKPAFAAWLARDPSHPTKFGKWLEILLKLGFRPYFANKDELMARKGPGANPSGDLACAENVALAKEFVKTPYTWRADTRPLDDIRAGGGFNTKADPNKGFSATNGLREPWNPFSKPNIYKCYWFRKGSNDNCKYTVVSVGLKSDWRKVISFPRLCDLAGWPASLFAKTSGSIRDFSALSKTDQDQVAEWFKWGWMLPAQCKADGAVLSKPVLLPAVRTHLYLLILGGVVIDTSAIQGKGDAFPEAGVRSLPLKHIYGEVEVVRFHHGATTAMATRRS